MKRFIKYGVVPVVTFLFLLSATIMVLPVVMNVQKYLPQIEDKLSDVVGRSVTIGSNFGLSFFPWLSISFSDLKIANPDGFQSDAFMKIESFEARLKLLPLLTKDVEVSRFIVGGLEVNLETREDGAVNWHLFQKNNGAEGSKSAVTTVSDWSIPQNLSIGLLAITNGTVNWQDNANNDSYIVDKLMFLVNDFTADKTVAVELQAAMEGKTLVAEGRVGPFLGKKPGQGVLPIDLAVNLGKSFSGKVKGELTNLFENPGYDVDLQTAPFSGQELLAYLNLEMPAVFVSGGEIEGAAKNLQSVTVDLSAKGDSEQLVIEKSKIKFDDTQIAFGLVLKDFEQPEIVFSLDADRLNLDRYLANFAGQDADSDISEKKQLGSKDLSSLTNMKITGAIQIQQLVLAGGRMGGLSAHLRSVDRVTSIDPATFSLYQGSAEVALIINMQGDVPSANMDVKMQNVAVRPLLHDFIEKDFLSGSVSGDVNLLFSGITATDIKQSLSANGELVIKDGVLAGIDMIHAVKNVVHSADDSLGASNLRTDFSEFETKFSIKNGMVDSRQSILSSHDASVYISGTADLNKEKLQLAIKPGVDVLIAQGGGDGQQEDSEKVVPFELSGDFIKPNIDIAAQYLPLEQLNLSDELDMQILVDEKLPSPVEEDVRDLIGTTLIDPAVVAQRFGLQPELLRQEQAKKLLTLGSGKVMISPLQEQEAWKK